MTNKKGISAVGNELASRAPNSLVFQNWRLWYLGIIIVASAVVLTLGGIFFSLKLSDWGFFGRSGAIVVILGTYLMLRPLWRRRYKSRFATLTTIEVINGVDRYTDEQLAEYIMERTDVWFLYIGFALAAIGSLIWGFGDLIGCFAGDKFPCSISALAHH